MAKDEQTEAVFKSSRAPEVDPVSGNEVPTGSLPEEVRDDIPAQLSEGEYVVPADVVRYYGVKFFEDLRTDAKEGWSEMEENGRIGGDPVGPEGMEMVEPEDDLPFDVSELEVREYNEGGMVGSPIFNSGLDNIFASPMSNITQKQYIGPDGQLMMLNFINGAPDAVANYYIGKGFKPADQAESQPEVESPVSDATEIAPQPSQDDGHSFNAFKKESALVENTAPKFAGKTAQDLIQYGDQLVDGKLGKAMGGAGMLNPMLGTLATATRRAEIFNVAKGLKEKYGEAMDAGNTKEAEEIDTAFQRITARGKERGSGVLGGGGLLGGGGVLYDVDGSGTVDFGDTWLGDLLGFDDGGAGVQGPSQSQSWNGKRRVGGTGSLSYTSLADFYNDKTLKSHALGTGEKLTGPATEAQAAPELTQADKEAIAKAATQDWVSATQAVKAAGNDLIAQHKARLAQSQASRAATRAIQEANNRTGFFGLQEKAPAPVSSNNAPTTNNNPSGLMAKKDPIDLVEDEDE